MAAFDINAYFAARSGSGGVTDKNTELDALSQAKMAEIEDARIQATKRLEDKAASKALADASWSGQLGLESNGFLGNRVNEVASVVSGASRLVGHIASAPTNLLAAADSIAASPQDIEAWNRSKTGAALPEDAAVLDRPAPGYGTVRQNFMDAEAKRASGKQINEFFNLEKIVDPTNRKKFTDSLAKGFESDWARVTAGTQDVGDGNVVRGGANAVAGLASILFNTGNAILSNPTAVKEYVLENAPQLFLGVAGKAGQAAQLTSNIGYAAETFREGVANYARDNGGQLPPQDMLRDMAAKAASLAAAEQVGDGVTAAATKMGMKATAGAVDATRIGFKESLKNVGKAAAKGFAAEAPTEGYQTLMEGDITGKPTTATDIFTGAVIGGVSGGVLAGGGRAVAEVTGSTPEKLAVVQAAAEKEVAKTAAVETGDVSQYLDPKSPTYAPSTAIDALYGSTIKEGTTEETKQANLEKANQVIADLEDRKSTLNANLALASVEGTQRKLDASIAKLGPDHPMSVSLAENIQSLQGKDQSSEIAHYEAQLAQVDEHLTASHASMKKYSEGIQTKLQEVDVEAEVSKITPADPVASQAAVNNIVNVSMASPDRLDASTATALADNPDNGLTEVQRTYFRRFSEARMAEIALKDMGVVSQEVLFGDKKGNIGIQEYRQRMSNAVATSNLKSADKQLSDLSKFAEDHQAKADVVATAVAQFKTTAVPLEVRSDGKRGWFINTGTPIGAEALKREGGVFVNERTPKLLTSIQFEVSAINKAVDELTSVREIKFVQPTQGSTDVTQAAQTQQAETQGPQSTADLGADGVGPVVTTPGVAPASVPVAEQGVGEQVVAPTVGTAATTTTVVQELPGSSVIPTEAKVVEGQEQSTEQGTTEVKQTEVAKAEDTTSQPPEVVATEGKEGTLAAVLQKGEEGATHGQKKLGDFFTQEAGKDTDASVRPLVAVKNFMQAWSDKSIKLGDYLATKGKPTEAQRTALGFFARKAKEWEKRIALNLSTGKGKDFFYEDPINFLVDVQTVGDKKVKDIEHNVKTAMSLAIVSFIADQASSDGINDDASINSALGRKSDAPVSSAARDLLEMIGSYQSFVVDSLGSTIMSALGMKLKKDVPQDMLAKLQMSLGAHALKLMEDLELVERTSVANGVMSKLRGTLESVDDEGVPIDPLRKGHHFFKLARNSKYQVVGKAAEIYESVKGSQGVLDKLFGVEPKLVYPSLTPSKGMQKATDTGMGIPSLIKQVFRKNQAMPWTINADPMKVMSIFGEDEDQGMGLAGIDLEQNHVHVRNERSTASKNNSLVREFNHVKEFMDQLLSTPDGIKTPFYLTQVLWKQQRAGYDNNTINPNTSKIVRWLTASAAWTTDIKRSDAVQLQSFFLRVSEGFGFKPEKKFSDVTVEAFKAKMEEEVNQEAVKTIQQILFNDKFIPTDEQKQGIRTAVKAGGQKLHTLAALVAYARYQQAKDTNEDTFTTNMMGESDGVSNGSVLNQIMYGAQASVDGLNKLLEKGGIYTLGSKFQKYNEWRGTPGHQDIYETNAQDLSQYISELPNDKHITSAIWGLVGNPIDAEEEATKDGRDLLKGPINPLNYGGGFDSIINKMSYDFVDKIYGKLEKFSQDGASQEVLDAFINNVNILLEDAGQPLVPVRKTIDFYLGHTLTENQEAALREAYSSTIGEAASEVVGDNFKVFLDRSKTLNKAANLAFSLYDAVYKAERDALIKSLNIPLYKGKPIHDLTVAQETELKERLKDITPLMHTGMSKNDGNLDNGILLAQTDKVLNRAPFYKVVTVFGTSLLNQTAKQLSVTGRSVVAAEPGVVALSATTHALDGMVSSEVQAKNHVVNNFDAVGDGVGTLMESTQILNQSTWEGVLNYSPLSEAHAALMRVISGMVALDKAGKLSPEAKTALVAALEKAKPKKGNALTVLDEVSLNVFYAAQVANRTKYEAMSQWAVVDQYAMDGGSYEVTPKNREEALDRLAKEPAVRSQEDAAALDAMFRTLFGTDAKQVPPEVSKEKAQAIEKAFGPVGKPTVSSESDLVAFFKKHPAATVKEIYTHLRQGDRLNDVNNKLLNVMAQVLLRADPNLKVVYVTPSTDPATLLDLPKSPSRGWYIANKEGKTEIYVLSPEFVNSGLTSETLLHEMLHAAVARSIANPTKETQPLIDELEALRNTAYKYAIEAKLNTKYKTQLQDVQEFVAWGMTNRDFQKDVLSQITYQSKTGANKFLSLDGVKALITTLTKMLAKSLGKAYDESLDNGLTVLVGNVSGLLAAASPGDVKAGNLNLSQENVDEVQKYSTMDILGALANGAVTPAFQDKLTTLVGTIVEKLHGPYGAFAASMRKAEAGNPLAVWLKAIDTGKAPFASDILASNFAGSAQEDFAMQQVEATVRAALEGGEVTAKSAYTQLSKLYQEMRVALKPTGTNPDELSQEDYDFMFKLESNDQGKSDYLARFAAIGLASERFNKAMQFATKVTKIKVGDGKSFYDKMMNVFEMILAFFSDKVTHTYAGQQADAKLEALVGQLVDIEAKKRHLLSLRATETSLLEPIEKASLAAVGALRKKVGEIAGSDFVRDSKITAVRFAGAVGRVYTSDQIELFLQGIRKVRDANFKERDGFGISMISEFKGPIVRFNELLRFRKKQEKDRKDLITNHAKLTLSTFDQEGKTLTDKQKKGVSAVLLRGGLHNLLGSFSMAQIKGLLDSSAALDTAIKQIENTLPAAFRNDYIRQANLLGFHKATGGVPDNVILMYNAHVIARMLGTPTNRKISEEQAVQVEADIASLVALYTVKYSGMNELAGARQVLATENARTDGNGAEFLLKAHKAMEQESLERIFHNNPVLMMHGYTPEILNPYTAMRFATQEEGENLVEQGYSKSYLLSTDKADPDGEQVGIYVLRDGGLMPWLSGVFSLSAMSAKGTAVSSGYMNPRTQSGRDNAKRYLAITKTKLADMTGKDAPDPHINFRLIKNTSNLAPIYNDQGAIVNWRYLMKEKTKDALLERNNAFDQIIGTMAGSIYDKATSNEVNKDAITALKEQYQKERLTDPDAYIEVGAMSPDSEMRELWDLLPEDTKKEVRSVWKKDGMKVRKDSLDIMFGYRKASVASFLRKDPEVLRGVQKIMRGWFDLYARSKGMNDQQAENFAKRMGLYLARGERAWQEIAKEMKDIIVVKTGVVLLGNIWSNLSLLSISGVPFKDIVHSHLVAMKGLNSYHSDSQALFDLEARLEAGYAQGNEAEMRREVLRLKDSINRNPVKELIDAGLMPTIVEDVAADEDIYSFKSAMTRRTEKFTNKLNPKIRDIGRQAYMTHDTKVYKFLSRTTQMSDFVARYTLYQHLTTRKTDPMTKAAAIQEASDDFVNYDIPMHRLLQYTDDMGITPFTKYFLRIQRVLLKQMKEHPARVLSTMLLNNFIELGPIVLDGSFVGHIGNDPIRTGALGYLGTLDDPMTIKAALSIFK